MEGRREELEHKWRTELEKSKHQWEKEKEWEGRGEELEQKWRTELEKNEQQ